METQMEQNVQLISEMIKNVANDAVPTICIFSLLASRRHLDTTTSRKSPTNYFRNLVKILWKYADSSVIYDEKKFC